MKKFGGIVLAGGNATRLSPTTMVVNKHFLPVYDKPMIFYSLSILLLTGINDITIVCKKEDVKNFQTLLGDEKYLGININFSVQENPIGLPDAAAKGFEKSKLTDNLVVLGDNFIHGSNFFEQLKNNLYEHPDRCSIFTQKLSNQKSFGVAEIDENGEIVNLIEKPKENKSNYSTIIGLYKFTDVFIDAFKEISPSKRGEYEIIDILKYINNIGQLDFVGLGRGTTWFDMGTNEDLYNSTNFVRSLQSKQQQLVCSPHEVALNKNLISKETFEEFLNISKESDYVNNLKKIVF